MRTGPWLVRSVGPFLLSAGALAYLATRIDFLAALDRVTGHVALVLCLALLAYGGLGLWIEAISLARLLPPTREARLDLGAFARMKAATYLFGVLHYALGAGILVLLLRRHARVPLAEAAGVVLLISFFDLGVLLLLVTVGATFLATEAPVVRVGIIAMGGLGLVGGLGLLRMQGSLGPLERIRSLPIFRAARAAPTRRLAELAVLRLLFVMTFMALWGAALFVFDISVPPGDLLVNIAGVSLVAVLPIALSGLGTGQIAFVYLFRHWGDPEILLACSLALSVGLILLRAGIGLVFAHEFTREAIDAVRERDV